jgi:hypothetical protein
MDQPASHQRQFVPENSRKICAFAGFAFCLLFPSFGVIQKYFGNRGLLIYLVAATSILWLAYRYLADLFLLRLSERRAQLLAVVTFVALTFLFALVFPKANVHVAGRGSDADDALNLAVTELVHGRYPYYVQTYLQNAIANFPGAILLAAPFVLLGNSAYQNLFWLAVFFLATSRLTQSFGRGLILVWTLLILSPVVMNYVVTGGDDLANSIYVLVFMLLTVKWVSSADAPAWKRVLAALVLGIGLSSRANFLLVMPQLFAALTIKAGWRAALKYVAVAGAAFAAVTIPFWIHDPLGFTPLHAQSHKVAEFQTILPFAGLVVPALGACLALALAWRSIKLGRETWLRDCAIVQAFLVICVATLTAIQTGTLSLTSTSYGVFFLFFGVLAFGPKMFEKAVLSANSARGGSASC